MHPMPGEQYAACASRALLPKGRAALRVSLAQQGLRAGRALRVDNAATILILSRKVGLNAPVVLQANIRT